LPETYNGVPPEEIVASPVDPTTFGLASSSFFSLSLLSLLSLALSASLLALLSAVFVFSGLSSPSAPESEAPSRSRACLHRLILRLA
jgi:hypothetical protein